MKLPVKQNRSSSSIQWKSFKKTDTQRKKRRREKCVAENLNKFENKKIIKNTVINLRH